MTAPPVPRFQSPAVTFGRLLANLLGAGTAYEFLLVGLETYGYSLTAESSYMVFMNAAFALTLAVLLFFAHRQAIRDWRLLHPSGWAAIGILGGTAALSWMWAVDRWLRMGLMGSEGAAFSLSPAAIVGFISRFHEKGYWGWGNAWYHDRAPVQGSWLTVWWVLEAFLTVVIPYAGVALFFTRHPQCRRCGSWLFIQEGARRLQGSRVERVVEALRSGDLSTLEEPDRPQKGDPFTLRIDLVPCKDCPETFYVNLVHERRVLLEMHRIPADQLQRIFKPVRGPSPKSPPSA